MNIILRQKRLLSCFICCLVLIILKLLKLLIASDNIGAIGGNHFISGSHKITDSLEISFINDYKITDKTNEDLLNIKRKGDHKSCTLSRTVQLET
jgi:hypothetical protein